MVIIGFPARNKDVRMNQDQLNYLRDELMALFDAASSYGKDAGNGNSLAANQARYKAARIAADILETAVMMGDVQLPEETWYTERTKSTLGKILDTFNANAKIGKTVALWNASDGDYKVTSARLDAAHAATRQAQALITVLESAKPL